MSKHESPEGQMGLFPDDPEAALIAEMIRTAEERKRAVPHDSGSVAERPPASGPEKFAGTYCARCGTERDAKGYCNCNRTWGGEKVA